MEKILNLKEAIIVAQQIKKKNKSIVVVGGIFDILHLGHLKFLEKSKKYGDYLFVLLEDDTKAAKEKSTRRPINSQKNRAKILSSLRNVNFIVMLENMTNDQLYDKLIIEMQPNIIATTYGDLNVEHKKRQVKLINARLVYAIKRIDNYSTSKYVKLINKN